MGSNPTPIIFAAVVVKILRDFVDISSTTPLIVPYSLVGQDTWFSQRDPGSIPGGGTLFAFVLESPTAQRG